MSTATLYLPRLRTDQYQIATHPAKTKVICMGRRWGKSVMGGVVALTAASQGGRVAWVVPTYKNGRALWRWVEHAIAPLRRHGVQINRSERLIEFPNGGGLGVYSADSEDSIRGEAFHVVVVDEAAKVPESTYTDVIQPTLADYAGDVYLISTPVGKNWFYHEWVKAQADGKHAAAWTAPSSDNPNPNIKRAFALAQERVPGRTFRSEWLAEFVEDGGEVFRNLQACAGAIPQAYPVEGHRYLIGVDLAKLNDFTVFAVLDITDHALVYLDRFSQVDYTLQLSRLRALNERFAPDTIIVERNIGEMFIELGQRAGLPIHPFQTTNASKQVLIESLAVAFEREELHILNDPILLNELQAFQMERLPSGALRYAAPSGLHDDTVMALALAWQGVQTRVGVDAFSLDISW